MKYFENELEMNPSLFKGLVNNDNDFDVNKWLQDKFEYEAMLHRVFGKNAIKNDDKVVFVK